ncbi:MAG TPA: flagellar basal-body rod protein FlgF [Candidatus Dormibacteraeota bacterium]|nr:flagellar basal-body rod protein FlgF [Candidatus Dormibacteraeota bacterium]
MIRGLYSAASGMLVAQSLVDTTANNLANVDTNGFKRAVLQVESAPTLELYRFQTNPGQTAARATPGVPTQTSIGTLGLGAQVYDTPTSFQQGSLQQTDDPLDLALVGPGFFSVQTPAGVRYTRDGSFVRSAQGELVTQSGQPVLSTTGTPITLAQGPFTVDTDGTVRQQGAPVAQLAVVRFANLRNLRPEGNDLFLNEGAGPTQDNTTTSVQQGYLEKSTVNVVHSMVDLISAERFFDANSKAVQIENTALGLAVQTVGANH